MSIKAWSEDEEEALKKMYLEDTKDVWKIAEKFEKSHRSVISKLVNLKIYEKPVNNKTTRTVKTMLRDLEDLLDITIKDFNLNKKSNLLIVVEAIERLVKK